MALYLMAHVGISVKTLRWIAAPLVGVLAWYIALVAGIAVASSLDHFCPPDLMVSGMCSAWWHSYAVDVSVVSFAGMAALLVVLSAALVAPSHKLQTAWVAYIVGCLFAVYAVLQTSAFGAFIAALLAGMIALLGVARFPGARKSTRA